MKVKKGRDTIIFNILSYILVGIFAFVCILPFYLIVVGSFTRESVIIREGYQLFLAAKDFSLEAYRMAFKSPERILHAYGITILVTVIGSLISIFLTTMTGYVLSRPDFPFCSMISSISPCIRSFRYGICSFSSSAFAIRSV